MFDLVFLLGQHLVEFLFTFDIEDRDFAGGKVVNMAVFQSNET